MDLAYWLYAAIDVALKQNLMEHAKKGQIPLNAWIGRHEQFPRVLVFGQLGRTPNFRCQQNYRTEESLSATWTWSAQSIYGFNLKNGKALKLVMYTFTL